MLDLDNKPDIPGKGPEETHCRLRRKSEGLMLQ